MTKTENITLLPYRERVKLVRERLSGMRSQEVVPLKKPASVEVAERKVRAWNLQNEAHCNAQHAAWRARRNEITDALIVGDMQKTVALLQKLGD